MHVADPMILPYPQRLLTFHDLHVPNGTNSNTPMAQVVYLPHLTSQHTIVPILILHHMFPYYSYYQHLHVHHDNYTDTVRIHHVVVGMHSSDSYAIGRVSEHTYPSLPPMLGQWHEHACSFVPILKFVLVLVVYEPTG